MRKSLFVKRTTAAVMTAVIAAVSLAGCSSSDSSSETTAAATEAAAAETEAVENSGETGEAESDKPYAGTKLTWWTKLNANVSATYPNLGDTPWAQYVQEQTGIEIEFIHPTVGSETEEFSIMVASGEYPDIIEHTWTTYAGGPGAAISDGVIINLDDVMANNAPNFSKLMAEHPDVDKMVKTSGGSYYCFPFLRGLDQPNKTQFSAGILVRKDVLDELGLEIPETIEEWDTVLRAYKEAGFEVPFTTRSEWMKDVWSPGFDSWGDFYVEDGVVKNGLIEDNRKEFLTQMNAWYEEGLIDRDYLVADKSSNQTSFTTGKSAAVYAPFGQGLGQYTQIMNEADPSITEEDIRGTVPVTSTKGKNAKFSKMNQVYDKSGTSAAISTQCENVEAAAYLLDWMFSEQGNLCCNYGIEGLTFEMVDGVPTYTDVIMNNPDGMSVANALAAYTRASTSGVCVQEEGYIEQYYEQDNQKEALDLCMKTDMGEHFFPPTSVTEENSEQYADIMSNVKTLSDEMEAQFISGSVSLDEWDSYVQQLKDFGIEDAIAMMQEAYDIYMAN
ncbi:MAG: extracellular solute-binding protein [Clostridiales bacterium]|nr:extracellular solute-binding protein [Clostridiales bacterium]